MIRFENQCVDCPQGCINCGRKHTLVLTCDDCGDDTDELFYGNDGGEYCMYCLTKHVEKVEIEGD